MLASTAHVEKRRLRFTELCYETVAYTTVEIGKRTAKSYPQLIRLIVCKLLTQLGYKVIIVDYNLLD